MKLTIALALALLLSALFAVPHYHLHYRSRPVSVSWKHIAAGGAAAGTVIAAYKVSNGVEEGLKTVAKKKSEAFTYPLTRGAGFCAFCC